MSELLEMPHEEKLLVDFIEIADIHFHHNCALPCLDEKGELISALVSAFSYSKDNNDRELVIEGHADRSGDANYNFQISKRRAEAIKALLENDGALWKGVVDSNKTDQTIETEDYQQTLKSLAVKYGWPCDPGAVDNKNGPKTIGAVRNFQKEYNNCFPDKTKLTVDGSVGPKTWQALFDVFRKMVEDGLKAASLDPPPTLTYGYPDGKGIYPCGESSPVTAQEKSEEDRRVELVFYKKGECEPVIAPATGRKIEQKKDPVTEKLWDKKAIPNNPPPVVQVKVSIKAEDGSSNPLKVLEKGKTIKFKAVPTPVGGKYQWKISGNSSIVGSASTEIVEIKGNNTSGTKEDITVSLEYEKDGKKAIADIKITVYTITIIPASMQATESLNSGTFTVDIQPAGLNVTAYKWLTGSADKVWPATAGNNPALNYSAPTKANTIVNTTRWFAPTPSNLSSVDGNTCTYKINCEVTIDGQKYRANTTADLNVTVENFTGSCSWPSFQNWQSIVVAKDASNVWKVTGQGSFSRRAPVVTIDTLITSQFYNKVLQHENLHVNQWTAQAPWKDLFNADTLYNSTLKLLTSNVSELDLRNKIFNAINTKSTADSNAARNTMCQRERAAWVHENTIVPDFLELTEAGWKAAYGCP